MVGLAQLVRALVCGAGGRGFESRISPHDLGIYALVAQLDRATDFGSVGYRFDSYRAYHKIFTLIISR